jgi:hypothetical protein
MSDNIQWDQHQKLRNRQYPRLATRCDFIVRIQGEEYRSNSANLSFGGAFLETIATPPVGTDIELELHSQEHNGSCMARVVHQSDNGIGITFLDPSEEFADAVYEAIFEHLAQNAEQGADHDQLAARIMLNIRDDKGYHGVFSCALGQREAWLLDEDPGRFADDFWITLSEHGVFDCRVRVVWRAEKALGVEFIDPSPDFSDAYIRVRTSFAG